MNVSAKDLGTGKQQQITISGSTANDDEVDRMVRDAEQHAEEDKRRREEVEVRNNCDALVNATEQTLAEVGDKAPSHVKSQAESAIAAAKSALEGTDVEAIKAATEQMQQAGYKLAEVVQLPPRARPRPPLPRLPRAPRPTIPSRPTTRWSTTRTKGSSSHDAEHSHPGARRSRPKCGPRRLTPSRPGPPPRSLHTAAADGEFWGGRRGSVVEGPEGTETATVLAGDLLLKAQAETKDWQDK